MALAATADLFSEEDCATKILPGICPSLIDKEKLVRDQANKTLDLYMARIRKYSQTLPDTVQPPASATAAGAAPRMGTPQSDSSSWAGWAISSFTNKLAAASGQMQAPNGTREAAAAPSQRASSVPPAPSAALAAPASAPRAPKPTAARSANPFAASDTALSSQASSARASEDAPTDWATAWAEPEPDPAAAEPEPWDADAAWPDDDGGDGGADPFAAKPAAAAAAAPAADGDAEPDFAGWLEAQARAKRKVGGAAGAKALPKGLARAPQRPAAPKKTGASAALKKTAAVAREQEEDEVGWGDAWE